MFEKIHDYLANMGLVKKHGIYIDFQDQNQFDLDAIDAATSLKRNLYYILDDNSIPVKEESTRVKLYFNEQEARLRFLEDNHHMIIEVRPRVFH